MILHHMLYERPFRKDLYHYTRGQVLRAHIRWMVGCLLLAWALRLLQKEAGGTTIKLFHAMALTIELESFDQDRAWKRYGQPRPNAEPRA